MKFWKMREGNSKGLEDLVSYINNYQDTSKLTMIEIGSYLGESTIIFAKHFKSVISIDPYINGYDNDDIASFHTPMDEVYKQFLTNTSNYKNIVNIRKTSDNAVKELEINSIDFVYIDGNHKYEFVKKDIVNYLPIVKNDGFIGGHDYKYKGVKTAIKETILNVDKDFCDNSWIKRLVKQ